MSAIDTTIDEELAAHLAAFGDEYAAADARDDADGADGGSDPFADLVDSGSDITIDALHAALAAERNFALAVFHANYDDGPDARAAALAAGLAAGRAAYRDALPGASTRDVLARLDAAIIAAIAVAHDADAYIGDAP